jgi:hypothetical protein
LVSDTELASFSGSGYVPQALLLLDDEDDDADEEDLSVGRENRFALLIFLQILAVYCFLTFYMYS